MATLLIRLCGPMQSWGTRSRFVERDTELEPSKSGVVGLLCAALGRPRKEAVDDLAALRLGVRVDREGAMASDYHTAGGVDGIIRASGHLSKDAVLSNRQYLAGADFLVGLEGDERLLGTIEAALRAPVWQLCLGRKSFVPAVPVHLPFAGGLRDLPLDPALTSERYPLVPRVWDRRDHARQPGLQRLRFVIQCDPGESAEQRRDQPTGAAFAARTFETRWVQTRFWDVKRSSDDV